MNYTWMAVKPRTVLFTLADTKVFQLANKNKTTKANSNEVGIKAFSNIFMKFESE